MKKLSNICIISSDYPTKTRAVMEFVRQLVEEFVDKGIQVNVVAPQSLVRDVIRRIGIMSRHETYLTSNGNPYEVHRPYTLSFGNGNKLLYKLVQRFNARHINTCLKHINPQVVYGHFWSSATYAIDYCATNDVPLFVANGESYDNFDKWISNLSAIQIQNIAQHTTGVISVSTENFRKCISHKLCTQQNSIVSPNCVDISLFHPQKVTATKQKYGIQEDDFVLIFVGGFIARKGPDRVARAITKLNDPHIKVMFVGKTFDGYKYDFDCPGIIHKGPIPHSQLPTLLNCADVFILPTRNEGCCNAIVEALACGIPVISSNGAFNDDILDKNNSIRVDANDVDGLTNAIAYLRDNPEVRQKMKISSLDRHNQYSIENRAKNIIKFMEENC